MNAGIMNGSSGNKVTRSSDDCDDDALANISSPLDDALTALRQKYGLINDVKEATIITSAAASPASGKVDILPPPPTISKSPSSSIKSFHRAAAVASSQHPVQRRDIVIVVEKMCVLFLLSRFR